MFIYKTPDIITYFLVYVDDLLITSSYPKFTQDFIHAVSHRFSIKDLGLLHFFLGVEATPTPTGLFLFQHIYIRDLLQRHQLDGMKEAVTPMSSTGKLLLVDRSPSTDASVYRSVIGSLQYLSLTRPDIAYTVNKLAQYMHAPTQVHWAAAKRLLHYLKHTIHYGLHLQRNQPLQLLAYSDADWAGDRDSYTSISADVIFLGGNIIWWCSKKQQTIARSSTEAEYRSVASTVVELTWITNFLSELGVSRCRLHRRFYVTTSVLRMLVLILFIIPA